MRNIHTKKTNFNRLNIKQNMQSGMGLIEVIAALSVAVIIITALVSLAIFTLRSSLQSRLLLQSSKLTSEELERARAFRDVAASWNTNFLTPLRTSCVNSNCYFDNSLTLRTGSEIINPNTPSQITRYFRVSDPTDGTIDGSENLIRVSVTVSWTVGNQTKYAHSYTDLSNWRGR
jgi:Tfp pilus assembly protein PilV